MKAFLTSIGLMTALVGCASTPTEAPVQSASTGNCANVAWSDNPDGKRSKGDPPKEFLEVQERFGAFLISPICGGSEKARQKPPFWPKDKKLSEDGKPDCLPAEAFGGQRICWIIKKYGE